VQEGEPQGRHVVIVDDLVQSGGTLIECHALLSSLGATHGEGGGVTREWSGARAPEEQSRASGFDNLGAGFMRGKCFVSLRRLLSWGG
jgi:orotate phosphoribosyltransferase